MTEAPQPTIEFMLLCVAGAEPRTLQGLLRLARARFPDRARLLAFNDPNRALAHALVHERGYLQQHPTGYTLTEPGELFVRREWPRQHPSARPAPPSP